jgi:Ni/Fe-hydrogenase subunit HybB-like protein
LIGSQLGAYIVHRDGLDITGLSNKVPWGLWVVIDLASITLGGSALCSA